MFSGPTSCLWLSRRSFHPLTCGPRVLQSSAQGILHWLFACASRFTEIGHTTIWEKKELLDLGSLRTGGVTDLCLKKGRRLPSAAAGPMDEREKHSNQLPRPALNHVTLSALTIVLPRERTAPRGRACVSEKRGSPSWESPR